jgi:hypothetical protein
MALTTKEANLEKSHVTGNHIGPNKEPFPAAYNQSMIDKADRMMATKQREGGSGRLSKADAETLHNFATKLAGGRDQDWSADLKEAVRLIETDKKYNWTQPALDYFKHLNRSAAVSRGNSARVQEDDGPSGNI